VKIRIQLIVQDTMEAQLFDANSLLSDVLQDLEALQAKIDEDSAARITIENSIVDASAAAELNSKDIAQVGAGLRYAEGMLKSQTVNASSLSTPVQTSIIDVATSNDKLSVTYPYLLILVIMFIGMLLSSILVVTDKTSRARFRNFTTPTSDNYHVAVSFATASLLLIVEVVVILLLSKAFVAEPLHLFSLSTIVIMMLAVVIFTFLGMVIGHLASTQEAAMISSISVGSILLFVSNLIIPIEGMARAVQHLTQFNPYVVLSELLKKSMFYGVTLSQISRHIILLILLCGVLLGLTLLIQRRNKQRYFKQDAGLLAPHVPAPLDLAGKQIHDEVALLDALDHMTRTEFESIIKSDDNIVSQWVFKELRNPSLARKLRTTSKERMILRLDKHLEKHGRHLRR
jgi:ABC-type multidrug transport system permease subunit